MKAPLFNDSTRTMTVYLPSVEYLQMEWARWEEYWRETVEHHGRVNPPTRDDAGLSFTFQFLPLDDYNWGWAKDRYLRLFGALAEGK